VRQTKVLGMGIFSIAIAVLGAMVLVEADRTAETVVAVVMLVLSIPIGVFPVLTNRIVRRQRRSRVAALVEARRQAPPVSPIGDGQGKCRIMGRVHVLVCAHGDDGDVAVRLTRSVEHSSVANPGPGPGDHTDVTDLIEVRACGRFAVIDDSGVAVVDPDEFEVLSRVAIGPFEEVATSARQDDMVEAIGVGRRVSIDDVEDAAELLGDVGYRAGEPTVLFFDGQDEPVIIVARRRD